MTSHKEPVQAIPHRCSDCPPIGYPTDKTRCASCDRAHSELARAFGDAEATKILADNQHHKEPVQAIPEDIMAIAAELANATIRNYERNEPANVSRDAIARVIFAEREKAALIVEQTDLGNNKTHMLARLAIKLAARAIRRGRHLTAEEKLANVQNWLASEEV